MATVMPGLRPQTMSLGRSNTSSRITTPFPQTGRTNGIRSADALSKSTPNFLSDGSAHAKPQSAHHLIPNPQLTIIDLEAILREKIRQKYRDIHQAFQNYDTDVTLSVTKGEFRRVLELFCLPMTTDQFAAVLAKVSTNPNGTVRYIEFMDKFYGQITKKVDKSWQSGSHRYANGGQQNGTPPKLQELNVDMIEKMLKDKISKNIKNIAKALRLFDYNRDGHIQRHELRKVLENYCFKLTDPQYDKLWQRYDFHHTGLLNYKDFLTKLGVSVDQRLNAPPAEGTKGALVWEEKLEKQKQKKLTVDLNKDGNMNFYQLEKEFRKRMKVNYANLKRAFLAFDANQSGLIMLEDLKSVLHNFTIPMSDQLFIELMEKLGFKASGKISWEAFLEKFQNPMATGNGQTLPVRDDNHKFFPIRGAEESKTLEEILRLLQAKVTDHYGSFKQAFLKIDRRRDGKITKSELRKVMDTFKFDISDAQFKELVNALSPEGNSISYHKFLHLFEPRDDLKEGHKWLNSVHRYNDKQKPAILAWETVEEILREKIVYHWKEISDGIVACDDRDEGLVYPVELKKILDKVCLPTTQEHFDYLVSRCEDKREDGKLNYADFLIKLGVDVMPGDLVGVSAQITQSSDAAEMRRMDDLNARLDSNNICAAERTLGMSPPEIVARLKDRMLQHSNTIRDAFVSYDRRRRGKISKVDFKKILETYGLHFTDEQYAELCSYLGFQKGFMNYTNFINSFSDPRPQGSGQEFIRTDNHHVNPIRGDQWGMTAEEVELSLRKKVVENFANLRGAFYKFDDNHNGALTKENFRRMLDAFMYIMTDEEFERLCAHHGITRRSKISYKDFLEQFEVRDTANGHHWISDHRFNETFPTKDMTAEEVHNVLAIKAHRQWVDLAKAFRTMDQDGNGVITRRELRDILHRFILPMGKEEFSRLWHIYDPVGRGAISHEAFLEKLTGERFAPGDEQGMSRHIIDNSYQRLAEHHEAQLNKHKQITVNQAYMSSVLNISDVHQKLKDRIRDHYDDMYSAFRKYDVGRKGYLTVNEIQKVLVSLNFFLTDDQFFELLDRLGLSTDNSKLNYELFLKAFEEGRKSAYGQRRPDVVIKQHPNWTPTKAEMRLRDKVAANADSLMKMFVAFDKGEIGRVSASEFRRVLDNFCFKMTDEQFKGLMSKIKMEGDKMVDYQSFLSTFTLGDTRRIQADAEKWLAHIQEAVRARTPHPLPIDEVKETLREAVTARVYMFARGFNEIDYAKIGVISKDDFRKVVNENAFRLMDDQFDKLWPTLPVNDFGNLDYKAFLSEYSGQEGPWSQMAPPPQTQRDIVSRMAQTPMLPPPTADPALRPSPAIFRPPTAKSPTNMKTKSTIKVTNRPLSTTTSYTEQVELDYNGPQSLSLLRRANTPALVDASRAEQMLKDVIYKNWKDMQRQFRRIDGDNRGTVHPNDFKDVIDRYLTLPLDDLERLAIKYDVKDKGMVNYRDFLRHFVLTMKTRENTMLERKMLPMRRTEETGTANKGPQLNDIMSRMRECVMENWKKMRRSFRQVDKNGTGIIAPLEFRRILKEFQINVSENEFFHILTFYDGDMLGKIQYNDFIRAFITA